MDIDRGNQHIPDEVAAILKRGMVEISDKTIIFGAIERSKDSINSIPILSLEEDLMCFLMPCIRNFLFEIYNENSKVDLRGPLIENLEMCIKLTDLIGYIVEMLLFHQHDANIIVFQSIIVEMSCCFHMTYKHCKESQEKYQSLTGECKEIKELYKKNQDFYLKFLNVLNILDIPNNNEAATVLLQAMQSILNIIKIVFGINIKALADSWKAYCNILEKHSHTISIEKLTCTLEIEYLTEQIQGFMNTALENDDEKQRLQSIKFSGFLLKVALKIINEYWEQLKFQYPQDIHRFLCSVYNYSLDMLGKWSLGIETQNCIQSYLFSVVAPFVSEKILCDNYLEQYFRNIEEEVNKIPGCLILDLKMLKYLHTLPKNCIDYIPLNELLNHIFQYVQFYFPELYKNPAKTGNPLFDDICSSVSECIIYHSKSYDSALEKTFLENIIGNDIWGHFLASEIWIRILRFASNNTKRDIVMGFMEHLDDLQIDSVFSSHKILFLRRFLRMLFNILSEEEFNHTLKRYPPHRYIHIWRLIGFENISVNHITHLDLLLDSFSIKTKSVETIDSADDLIQIMETLRLISTVDLSLLDTKYKILTDCIIKFWNFNYEGLNLDNAFLKYFISKLCDTTIGSIKFFSNDQIITILQNMKELTKTSFSKLQMCQLLRSISSRPIELDKFQNKLNSLISDLIAMLLMEHNEVVKEISLETFQQFALNDYYVVVNNVARMLPQLNLEQYLQQINNDEFYPINCVKALEIIPLEHKCVSYGSREFQSVIPKKNSFEMEKLPTLSQELPREPVQKFNRSSSHKRIKLIENFENDDTVDEIIERIKSEIKCLSKVLSKEKITLKNAHKIKMLAGQLENSVYQN